MRKLQISWELQSINDHSIIIVDPLTSQTKTNKKDKEEENKCIYPMKSKFYFFPLSWITFDHSLHTLLFLFILFVFIYLSSLSMQWIGIILHVIMLTILSIYKLPKKRYRAAEIRIKHGLPSILPSTIDK